MDVLLLSTTMENDVYTSVAAAVAGVSLTVGS